MANYVKFKQGLKKDFNTTNQPLTNGMIYFVIDENNHGSIYYDTIVDGKKGTKNETVHRVKFSGLPIKITGSVIGTGVISQDGETIEINTSTNHSHGLAHQDFTVTLSNDDTNLKWTRLGNQNGGGFWLKSIRGNAKAPAWFLPDYSAGIAFGGEDTKGVISVRYNQPSVRFAGGNGSAPVWYFTITGSNDKTYDLNGIGGHSNDSAKLDHNVTFKIASTADATKGGSGTATNLSGSAVDLYLPTKISGFDLLQATRFQGNADTSTVAAKLGRGGNTSLPMTFNWSGQGGQPTWLWGGENGTDMYVYNPSNFNVNYANSAGNADTVDSLHANSFLRKYNANNEVSNTDELKTNSYIFTHGDSGDGEWPTGTKPPGSHNGVAILHTHTHAGDYYTQLALDTAQNALWIRSANATTSFGTWERVLTNTNYTSTVDNRYVKKSGDSMTGTLSVTGNASNVYPSEAAIEVRECGRVGNAQTENVYAPRLGFHWQNRWWCQLALQDGRLKVYDAEMSGLFPFQASQVYGAVWNDYAEYRLTSKVQPGQCVIETGLGDLVQSTKRLQPGANIVSDTFGFAIGETEQTKTPLAVSGRVLAYPYEDRYSYSAGDPVCSGPNGTISKMTREEVRNYPDRIVGTVSEIPEYETWGTGNVKVNGRIWIKVK